MRILVGTLRTIENEFSACVEALNRQTHREFEHFVVRDLPNKQAHDALYDTFMRRAGEFDLFVKVDADMVIQNGDFFRRLIASFEAHSDKRGIVIPVHDFFTDTLIRGLHAYRSGVKWNTGDEEVFVDPSPVDGAQMIDDVDDLTPAAEHCPDPSPFQAFHFGAHKGLKAREALERGIPGTLRFHSGNVEQVWRHFLRNGDVRLGLAALGGEMGLAGRFRPEHMDFDHPRLSELLKRYEDLDAVALARAVRRLRRRNWGWLAPDSRREVWTDGPVRFLARRVVPKPLHHMLSGRFKMKRRAARHGP